MCWHRLALPQRDGRSTKLGHRARQCQCCSPGARQRGDHTDDRRQQQHQREIELPGAKARVVRNLRRGQHAQRPWRPRLQDPETDPLAQLGHGSFPGQL